MAISKPHPCIWFENQAEEAANFYVSVFSGSITHIARYPESSPYLPGQAIMVAFDLNGVSFNALNGNAQFPHDEAVSFIIHCDTQEEIDRIWAALLADGGRESRCGWIADKYGVCWQIVPDAMGKYMTSSDPAVSGRVMAAFMPMAKIDIQTLEDAFNGV